MAVQRQQQEHCQEDQQDLQHVSAQRAAPRYASRPDNGLSLRRRVAREVKRVSAHYADCYLEIAKQRRIWQAAALSQSAHAA